MDKFSPLIVSIVAIIAVASLIVICVANDINHGLVYTGVSAISGIAGYNVARRVHHL